MKIIEAESFSNYQERSQKNLSKDLSNHRVESLIGTITKGYHLYGYIIKNYDERFKGCRNFQASKAFTHQIILIHDHLRSLIHSQEALLLAFACSACRSIIDIRIQFSYFIRDREKSNQYLKMILAHRKYEELTYRWESGEADFTNNDYKSKLEELKKKYPEMLYPYKDRRTNQTKMKFFKNWWGNQSLDQLIDKKSDKNSYEIYRAISKVNHGSYLSKGFYEHKRNSLFHIGNRDILNTATVGGTILALEYLVQFFNFFEFEINSKLVSEVLDELFLEMKL